MVKHSYLPLFQYTGATLRMIGATLIKHIATLPGTCVCSTQNIRAFTRLQGETIAEEEAPPAAAYVSIQLQGDALQSATLVDHSVQGATIPVEHDDPAQTLLHWLQREARLRHLHFIAASVLEDERFGNINSRLWLEEDIVPFILSKKDPLAQLPLTALVWLIAARFNDEHIAHPEITPEREVLVTQLVTLAEYQRITQPAEFELLTRLARAYQGKRLIFINATPQGGGVALMRHALIRLLRLLHVDAHWYVLVPSKAAFDITKTKFHNVLQAVASQGTELTEHDVIVYDDWMFQNAEILRPALQAADVIVIDDPQPSGLIPYIKRFNPAAKIIYRSHIQIEGALASQSGTPQHTTWQFLWQNIQQADLFISHPIKSFIPSDVPSEKILYMPATTDPLDGLNKPLTEEQMQIFMQQFNMMLRHEQQIPLDENRPYIVQIARFDPSKGIPDVLEAYGKLRDLLEDSHEPLPQLVIAGNSSIDDPDGMRIFNLTMELLQSEPYMYFADDVKVVRLPHQDQVLNTLLRKSRIALQLSIREGFEVKVTEALMKGKPVVAYRVGGIPLQIQDGVDGYLVKVGDTTQVALDLYELLTSPELYHRMSEAARLHAGQEYTTVPDAICWLYLATALAQGQAIDGHYQWVKALTQKELAA